MSVLNFSYAEIKDRAAFQDYVRQAALLMQKLDVEVVVRGELAETKRGTEKPDHIAAVFRYPNLQSAHDFYESADYQALIPLRDKACEMSIYFYHE